VSYRGKSLREKQTLINTAWVSMPVGILIALGIAFLLHMHPPNSKADSDSIEPAVYTRSIAYTFFGVVLAFLHEPMFLLALSDMKQGLRARVTVAAQFGKSFVQVILLVVFADKGFGIEAFALANVAYAGVLLLGYLAHFALCSKATDGDGSVSLLPKRLIPSPSRTPATNSGWYHKYFDPALFAAIMMFWMQAVQKWFLENGEKLMLVFLGTAQDAGGYILISNLGSIVARILLQPVEEMSLAAFSKLEKEKAEHAGVNDPVYKLIRVLILVMSIVGLMFTAFGPAFSHLLLSILYGPKWSETDAPFLLAVYCVYICTMALNGILEAFVQGVAEAEQLKRYNYWMVAFSVAFLASVFALIPYGIVGLIVANIVKMLCRIFVCLVFYLKPYMVNRRTGKAEVFRMRGFFPKNSVLLAFSGSFVLTQLSQKWIYYSAAEPQLFSYSSLGHLFVGVVCFSVTSAACWSYHRMEIIDAIGGNEKDGRLKEKRN
jgi:oligosaccharide translocation protein RFT1